MEVKKLVILDKNDFNENQKKELKTLAKEVIVYNDMPESEKEAIKRIGDADALIVCWFSLSEKIIDSCKNLKYLGVVATGYGWLAAEYASKKGIIVTNIPGYATEAVSNFIFKQLGNFNTQEKIFGIIGLGRIGTKIAEIAQEKGFKVIYWNRTKKNTNFKQVDFDDIFSKSNIIVLQVKSTKETQGIVKNKNLDSVKEGAIIINVVSPKLFEDEEYLISLIEKKKLRLILDFEENSKLKSLSNKHIIYTGGIAWKSPESIFNLHQIAIENIKSYLQGKIQNKISMQ